MLAVEERSMRAEAASVRSRGVHRSENVGISNKYRGENPLRRISKGSWGRIVLPGLAEPKSGPQEVHPMENTVDIP
jgi:hypothetical protein